VELDGGKHFLLRNPWGNLRAINEDSNGLFFIKVEDYLEAMDYTYINYDTTGWYHAYFMMWDDPAKTNGQFCGDDCTMHRIYVRSSIAQKVWVGAHTYTYYTYPDAVGQCPVNTQDAQITSAEFRVKNEVSYDNSVKHVIRNSRDDTQTEFDHGSGWLDVIEFRQNEEIAMFVEFNWNKRGITKDWSLTAWGTEGGKVTVRHDQGLASEHFPFTEKTPEVDKKPEWKYTPETKVKSQRSKSSS
jgi:hypothetical protein